MRTTTKLLLICTILVIASLNANAELRYFQTYTTQTAFDGNVTDTLGGRTFTSQGVNITLTAGSKTLQITNMSVPTNLPAGNCSGFILNLSYPSNGADLVSVGFHSSITAGCGGDAKFQLQDNGGTNTYNCVNSANPRTAGWAYNINRSIMIRVCGTGGGNANVSYFNATQTAGVWSPYNEMWNANYALANANGKFAITGTIASDRTFLWQSLLGWNDSDVPPGSAPPPPPPPSAGSIIAADRYDSVNISVFNVSLTNSTGTFRFNTTNGTVSPGIAGNFTINFTRGDYFLFSNFSEINGTSIINLTPWQAVVNLNLSEIITGLELSVNGNNVTTFNGQSTNRTLFVRAAKYNITARRAGYFTITREFNAPTAVTNTTINFINLFTTVINITANNIFDTSIVNDFNITLSNGTHSINYTTNNGRVEAGTLNTTWSINISTGLALQSNLTLNAQNTTHQINFTLTSVWLDAIALEKVTNNSLFNFTLFTPQFAGKNSSNGTMFLKSGRINVTLSKAPYFNKTVEFNFVSLGNLSFAFANMSYSTVNFSAKLNGVNPVGNFTVNLTSRNTSFVFYQELLNASNFTVQANLINGSYRAIFTNRDNTTLIFALIIEDFVVNDTFKNVNVSFKQVGVLGIQFRDERTNFLINFETISIEMISTEMSTNFTTSNGTASTPILIPSIYTIRYSSLSYVQRFFMSTVIVNTSQDLILYMINTSIQTDTTITIVDELNNPVPNAKIYTQRYDSSTNLYKTVEILNTNTKGKVLSHLQLNTASQVGEFYKFMVLVDGNVKLETVPSYIYDSAFTLQINLNNPIAESFYKSRNVSFSLSFNNDTNNFRYTFVDANNEIENGCLNIYQITGRANTLVNTSCINTTSGTILLPISPTNGTTYKATATIQYDPNGNTLIMASQIQSLGTVEGLGKLGAFMIGLVMMVMFFVGIWNPVMALIFLGMPLVFASYAGLTALPLWLTMGLEAILLIMAYFISDKA